MTLTDKINIDETMYLQENRQRKLSVDSNRSNSECLDVHLEDFKEFKTSRRKKRLFANFPQPSPRNSQNNALFSNDSQSASGAFLASNTDAKLSENMSASSTATPTAPPSTKIPNSTVSINASIQSAETSVGGNSHNTRESLSSTVQTMQHNLQRRPLSSAQSTGCLSNIPIDSMRTNRNFLVGSTAGPQGALLGANQLTSVFFNRQATVMLITWNMAMQHVPDSDLRLLLLPEGLENTPDLFVICLQENNSEVDELLVRIQAELGGHFVMLSFCRHGTLLVCVFCRKELIWYFSVASCARLTTRYALRTKGATAISLVLFGTSFLFINSHFQSHDGKFGERLSDYNAIIGAKEMQPLLANSFRPNAFPLSPLQQQKQQQLKQEENSSQQNDVASLSNPTSSSTVPTCAHDICSRFDITFWAGDLNFRLKRPISIVKQVVRATKLGENPNYEDLLLGDELHKGQTDAVIFQQFEEGRVNFPPSYKYEIGQTSRFTKDRIPSYTDRILYRTRQHQAVACLDYNLNSTLTSSDHKPVYGVYRVELRAGRDNIPLSAGSFDRDIYIKGTQRRALRQDIQAMKFLGKKMGGGGGGAYQPDPIGNNNSRVCVIQ